MVSKDNLTQNWHFMELQWSLLCYVSMKIIKQWQIQDKSNDLAKYSSCNLKSQKGAELAQIHQSSMAEHSSLNSP